MPRTVTTVRPQSLTRRRFLTVVGTAAASIALILGGVASIGPAAASTPKLPTLTAPAPTISGIPAVGQQLTASASFTPTPLAYTYQWKRNGSAISHAKFAVYRLVVGDAGKKLTVTATAIAPGYRSTSATSAKLAIEKVLTATPIPKLSGTAKAGHTLTVKPGGWKPSGVKLSYRWFIGATPIDGATRSTYKVQPADVGTIWVAVTGSKSGYTSVTRNSLGTLIH